jgi:cell wall-associated NlpC family hydrolase
MPDNRRAPKLLAYLLAVPIVALVYCATFGARIRAALRPAVATFLGATVVGSIYAGEAWKRTPARPLRAAATLGLAIALVAPAISHVPTAAAADPAQAVVEAARHYLGRNFSMGATGPRVFDCSGLVYRVFADVGELPRISGMRLGATAYMRWFVARGRFSHDESDAEPGDLVVWNNGEHIGIYIGNGRAISALINPWGVSVHGLHAINKRLTQFLLVNWGRNDGSGSDTGNPPADPGTGDSQGDTGATPAADSPPAANPPADNPPADTTSNTTTDTTTSPGNGTSNGNTGFKPTPANPRADGPPADSPPDNPPANPPQDSASGDQAPPGVAKTTNDGGTLPDLSGEAVRPPGFNGITIATLNLREQADSDSRIVGWIGSGAYVRIIGQTFSPQGFQYFQVETPNGKIGWVYSRWVLNSPG